MKRLFYKKKAYDQSFEIALESGKVEVRRETRDITKKNLNEFVEDAFLKRAIADEKLTDEDMGNITWIVQQPKFKSLEKYLIMQSLEFLYKAGSTSNDAESKLFARLGNFIKSLLHDMHTVKKQELPDTPDEW